ncbi:hypothetical protein VTK73DRAFT_7655 [Phialemonium thermophilum]|uniref:Alkaline phytoceramidase n=1 Tax=Phialemonium thermophilum TaxID=223376 RepID=A0ABR3Y7Q5_9PEZI
MANLFQIPYRVSREGFWGDQTSTLNWCEEDYNITKYCAEVVNTATNIVFMWLGLKGIRNCLLYSHPRVFILAYLGYMVVGLGSMAFHSTLKYSMQLADELPMIYTTCIMAYASLTYAKSVRFSIMTAAGLIFLAWSITAYYLYAKDPVFHQVAYGVMTGTIILRGMTIMEYDLRPALRERNGEDGDMIMRQMWMLAATGITMFLTGFFIWNMDNIYCQYLIQARNYILLPWAVLLEGHGWWHILTGLGEFAKPPVLKYLRGKISAGAND